MCVCVLSRSLSHVSTLSAPPAARYAVTRCRNRTPSFLPGDRGGEGRRPCLRARCDDVARARCIDRVYGMQGPAQICMPWNDKELIIKTLLDLCATPGLVGLGAESARGTLGWLLTPSGSLCSWPRDRLRARTIARDPAAFRDLSRRGGGVALRMQDVAPAGCEAALAAYACAERSLVRNKTRSGGTSGGGTAATESMGRSDPVHVSC